MEFELKPGFSAKIESIDDKNPASKKLLNMGLTPDTRFSVVKTAPLGDPVIINVRNYFLAIRKKDLLAIVFNEVKEEIV